LPDKFENDNEWDSAQIEKHTNKGSKRKLLFDEGMRFHKKYFIFN